jgi:hypothetical protein
MRQVVTICGCVHYVDWQCAKADRTAQLSHTDEAEPGTVQVPHLPAHVDAGAFEWSPFWKVEALQACMVLQPERNQPEGM